MPAALYLLSMASDLSIIEVIPRLPDFFNPSLGELIPGDIIGATIIAFGSPNEPRLMPGGGLIIDYCPRGSSDTKRLVIATSDVGASIKFSGRLPAD